MSEHLWDGSTSSGASHQGQGQMQGQGHLQQVMEAPQQQQQGRGATQITLNPNATPTPGYASTSPTVDWQHLQASGHAHSATAPPPTTGIRFSTIEQTGSSLRSSLVPSATPSQATDHAHSAHDQRHGATTEIMNGNAPASAAANGRGYTQGVTRRSVGAGGAGGRGSWGRSSLRRGFSGKRRESYKSVGEIGRKRTFLEFEFWARPAFPFWQKKEIVSASRAKQFWMFALPFFWFLCLSAFPPN